MTRIWPSLLDISQVVEPETILRWHRSGFRAFWRWKSRNRIGRPKVDRELRDLIRRMGRENPLWGAPRIHGELLKLGVEVSERTVSRLLQGSGRPASQTWRTFLTNHVSPLISIDFFTVPTFTGRVLFILVVLMHHRRRIVHVDVTEHPTAAWTAQQIMKRFRTTPPLAGC